MDNAKRNVQKKKEKEKSMFASTLQRKLGKP